MGYSQEQSGTGEMEVPLSISTGLSNPQKEYCTQLANLGPSSNSCNGVSLLQFHRIFGNFPLGIYSGEEALKICFAEHIPKYANVFWCFVRGCSIVPLKTPLQPMIVNQKFLSQISHGHTTKRKGKNRFISLCIMTVSLVLPSETQEGELVQILF